MPKLNYPQITKANVIKALMDLYRNYPPFMNELNEIKEPYIFGIDNSEISFNATKENI
jgi:hypothetical protein